MNYDNAIKKKVLTFMILGQAKITKNTLTAKIIYGGLYQEWHYNDNV